jgi:hypothetical protein
MIQQTNAGHDVDETQGEKVNISCIKVDESYAIASSDTHQNYVTKMSTEDRSVIKCVNAIHKLDPNCCFDNISGVTEKQLKDATRMEEPSRGETFYVFDWDRTISKVEGFIGAFGSSPSTYTLSTYGEYLRDVEKKARSAWDGGEEGMEDPPPSQTKPF